MIYNILNGDALAFSFPDTRIEGDIIVVREALMDGDLSGNNLNDFWQSRAKYHSSTEGEYHSEVVKEFEKIMNAPDNSEFNLWFEYDLFCQVNMWFVISIIKVIEDITKNISTDFHKVFREFWNRESIYGFGDIQLKHLYDKVMRSR